MGTIQNNEVKGETTLTFMVTASSVFDHKKKLDVLKKFAALDPEDQVKLEKLIDSTSFKTELNKQAELLKKEDKERVLQIINSPKALAALKSHWLMLKTMFS